MNLHILDTDILTLFEKNHPAVIARVRACQPSELAITILTVEQQLSGWYTRVRKARNPKQLAKAYRELSKTVRFFARLQIIDYDEAAIGKYEELRKQKLKIGKTDLRIAATVLVNQAKLITANLRDFKKVPGLHIEDWSR